MLHAEDLFWGWVHGDDANYWAVHAAYGSCDVRHLNFAGNGFKELLAPDHAFRGKNSEKKIFEWLGTLANVVISLEDGVRRFCIDESVRGCRTRRDTAEAGNEEGDDEEFQLALERSFCYFAKGCSEGHDIWIGEALQEMIMPPWSEWQDREMDCFTLTALLKNLPYVQLKCKLKEITKAGHFDSFEVVDHESMAMRLEHLKSRNRGKRRRVDQGNGLAK